MLREILHKAQDLLHYSNEKDKHLQLKWSNGEINTSEIRKMKGELIFENKADYSIALFPLEFDRELGGKKMIHIISILNGASSLEDQKKLIFKAFQVPGEKGKIIVARKSELSELDALDILVKAVDLSEPNLTRARLPLIPPPHRNIFTLNQ